MVRKIELKSTVDLSHFESFNIMSCFIYSDLITLFYKNNFIRTRRSFLLKI